MVYLTYSFIFLGIWPVNHINEQYVPLKSYRACVISSLRKFSDKCEFDKIHAFIIDRLNLCTIKYFENKILHFSQVMTEEIFGPILPIITVNSAYDAIKFINERWVFKLYILCLVSLQYCLFNLNIHVLPLGLFRPLISLEKEGKNSQ